MADFSALKTAIQANIRTNANEEITGAILQEILLSMVTTMGDGDINGLVTALQEEVVDRQNAVGGEVTARQEADSALSGRINAEATARGEADTQLQNAINGITTRLNEGYVYVGIATPSTNPSTPTGKVFYIALQGGTYTNFSGLTVTQGINILKYNGSAWSLDQLWGVDDEPTAGSNNLVKSGGVYSETKHLSDEINNVKTISQFGLAPYTRSLVLNGLSSYDNLKVRLSIGNAFTYQVFQGTTLISYGSIGKTENSKEYILDVVSVTLLEYENSGVSGNVVLSSNRILKNYCMVYYDIVYPYNESLFIEKFYNLLDNKDGYINKSSEKSRKDFWTQSIYLQNNTHKLVSQAIREIYLIKPDGSTIDETNIVLGNIRKGYNNNYRVVFFVGNSPSNEVIGLFETTQDEAVGVKVLLPNTTFPLKGYMLIDWDKIESESNLISSVSTDYLIDWNVVSTLANCPTLFSYLNIKDSIVKTLNTPDFSWVDDDFNLESVPRIKTLGLQEGFRSDFAVTPDVSGGTGEYPTNYTFSLSSQKLSLIQEMEDSGFHCEHHPIHRGWYASQSAGTYQGREYIEYLLCEGMRCFKRNYIQNTPCVVYPGDSGLREEVVETCRSHLEYGIMSSGTYNVGAVDPLRLQRLFISLDSTHTKTYWKSKIYEAYIAGAWLIIGTHSYEFDNSGTIDETTKSFANLADIIHYANSLSIIKPVSEVFRKRKPMLDLYLLP